MRQGAVDRSDLQINHDHDTTGSTQNTFHAKLLTTTNDNKVENRWCSEQGPMVDVEVKVDENMGVKNK
jgi:hypothetical protein